VSETGSQYRLRLQESTDPGRQIFAAAREAGAEVRGFRRAVRSLEDVVMEVVE
jgi:hypothetical protein